MEDLQIMVIIMGGILAFALFWLVIVWLIAKLSGWSKLADNYPSRIPFNETCWSLQSARFRWNSNYSGILRVCADSQALHLSVFSMFRPGNPPLSIPGKIFRRRLTVLVLNCAFTALKMSPYVFHVGWLDD